MAGKSREAEERLAGQLQEWHEKDEFEKIIETIEGLPEEEQTAELISLLARAYNNLATSEDRHYFKKAIALLKSVEEELAQDHGWNFRIGYAYYYLDQEKTAKDYFEKALEYRPGDEDTMEFIRLCEGQLTIPISMRPFRKRTELGWASFLEGEEKLRAMLDEKKHGDELAEYCAKLLAPAFEEIYFEIGFNGKKYELILTPEGDRARLFKLVYFRDHAPGELLDRWNIIVGRQASRGFQLQMLGQEISAGDVRVWVEDLEDKQIGLSVYCEKLLPMLRENENQAYSIMTILLDQNMGELAAMRYIGYLDMLEEPREGEALSPEELSDHIRASIDPENFDACTSGEKNCEWYTAYQMKPVQEEQRFLRRDVYVGMTSCMPLLAEYYRGEDHCMEDFHRDGAVPGFLYYSLEGIAKEDVLTLRDTLEEAIREQARDAVTFIGGATGTEYGYLDLIAWDLGECLDAADTALSASPVLEAAFHTFRWNASSVWMKSREEDEA